MANPLKKVKEIGLIEGVARRFKPKDQAVVVGIGDDAAAVKGPKGARLLYTCDMLIESVHFKKNEDPRKIGYKAMAVSVSDIAAMGGIPKYALVSVGLPKKGVDRIARGLFEGIGRCARKFHVDVIGGDTNRSPRLVIDVFMAGVVEKDRMVLRSTAKPGDFIFVSGPLGGSFRGKHLDFIPRLKEARFLVENFKVTSMIDLSDGLGMDLNRLAQASGVGALVFENRIPRSKGVASTKAALFDGEDFELLFTLSKTDALELLHRTKRGKNMKFYFLGRITDLFSGVRMITKGGETRKVEPLGFRHF